jgi:hypothetical protein
VLAFGSVGVVDYLPGFEQSDHWHAGFGAGLVYQPRPAAGRSAPPPPMASTPARGWPGAISFTMMVQYDLDAVLRDGGELFWEPFTSTRTWQGLFRRVGAR